MDTDCIKKYKKIIIFCVALLLLTTILVGIFLIYKNNGKQPTAQEISAFLDRLSLNATQIIKTDINENGIDEYVVEAIPKECGSCHSRPFFIIENGKVIFEYNGDDFELTNLGYISNNELLVKEPVRIEGEAMCCPTTFKQTAINCPKFVGISYCYIKESFDLLSNSLIKEMNNPNREKGVLEKSFK